MYATMLRLSIGFITLTTGRQLYWLYAGGVAFINAFFLAPLFFNLPADSELLIIALGAGVIVALLTLLLGRMITAVVLFLAGGYLLITLPNILGLGFDWATITLFVIAGVMAVLMALIWFDFSLILLSALTGASLIIQTVNLSGFNAIIAFFGMVIFGMVTQAILLQYWPTGNEA